jgi:hypothetical protein
MKAFDMLVSGKSDTELLEIMVVAMTDGDNELLHQMKTSSGGYLTDGGKANIAVVEAIVKAVESRSEEDQGNLEVADDNRDSGCPGGGV